MELMCKRKDVQCPAVIEAQGQREECREESEIKGGMNRLPEEECSVREEDKAFRAT